MELYVEFDTSYEQASFLLPVFQRVLSTFFDMEIVQATVNESSTVVPTIKNSSREVHYDMHPVFSISVEGDPDYPGNKIMFRVLESLVAPYKRSAESETFHSYHVSVPTATYAS